MSVPKFLARSCSVVAAALALYTVPALGASYVYVDTAELTSSIMIDTKTSEGAIGDRGSRVELCEASDAFRCFQMEDMIFAVPKKFDVKSDHATWQFRNQRFMATRVPDVMILGSRYEIFFVDSQQAAPVRFWYSPHSGLIAIKGLQQKQDRVFLLRSPCGFASDPMCK